MYEEIFDAFDGHGFSIGEPCEVDIDVRLVKELAEIYQVIYWSVRGSLVKDLPEEAVEITEERLGSLLGFQITLHSSMTIDEILSIIEDLFPISREDIFEFCSSPIAFDLEDFRDFGERGVKVGIFFKEYSKKQFEVVLRKHVCQDLEREFSKVFLVTDTISGERSYNHIYPKGIWDRYIRGTFLENEFESPQQFEDVIVIQIMKWISDNIRLHGVGRNVVDPFVRKGFRPGVILILPEYYKELSKKFPWVVSFHKLYYLPAVSREIKRRNGGKDKK